jgi:hypothetical protein
MSKINDGGPAFPVPNDANTNGQEGMTLRDWFAGQALVGKLAAASIREDGYHSKYAAECYTIADAMLAARNAANDT